jgi:hypothetical protein
MNKLTSCKKAMRREVGGVIALYVLISDTYQPAIPIFLHLVLNYLKLRWTT